MGAWLDLGLAETLDVRLLPFLTRCLPPGLWSHMYHMMV